MLTSATSREPQISAKRRTWRRYGSPTYDPLWGKFAHSGRWPGPRHRGQSNCPDFKQEVERNLDDEAPHQVESWPQRRDWRPLARPAEPAAIASVRPQALFVPRGRLHGARDVSTLISAAPWRRYSRSSFAERQRCSRKLRAPPDPGKPCQPTFKWTRTFLRHRHHTVWGSAPFRRSPAGDSLPAHSHHRLPGSCLTTNAAATDTAATCRVSVLLRPRLPAAFTLAGASTIRGITQRGRRCAVGCFMSFFLFEV